MGLAEILTAMEDAAHEEERRLLDDARAEAERLLAAAKEDVAAMRERQLRRAAEAAARVGARLRAANALERGRKLARVRDEFVDRAFEAAKEALQHARETERYPAGFRLLVEEALDQFPLEEPLTIRCDPRDAAGIAAIIEGANRAATVEEGLDCWGGLVVADTTGRVIVDNTLERRIERAREVLWPAVAAEQVECLDRAASREVVPPLQ